MWRLVVALCAYQLALVSCGDCDSTRARGLEERALDAEVVLAAYTRIAFRPSNDSDRYTAELLVFNIIKGEDRVSEVYGTRQPSPLESALNRRLVNVSNFGDISRCESDVVAGETYILLLDVDADGQLVARYDGAYGPAVLYSKDKETALEAIGSSPWGEWSPCSGSCDGGIQQRKRHCDDAGHRCPDEEGQQRTCNMFPCAGLLNVLEVAGVHRSSLRPTGRPSAFRLVPSGSWRSGKEEIVFPRTFPWEFSLLVTVRVKRASTGGFLLRVLHSDSLQVGLYMSDILTLVLSEKNNVRVSFVKSLFDDGWHQLAFSVRRDTVSFFLNCEQSAKLPLPGKIRPFGGIPATVIVGSTGEHELDAFQGDIEQLTITGSPDAAERQCNGTTQPLSPRSGGRYILRQEVRSRPMSTFGTQNDQLPLRGDLLVDDEDFSFEEPGSGDEVEEKKPKEHKIPLKSEPSDDDASAGGDEDEDDDEEDEEEDDDEVDEEDEEEDDKEDDEADKIGKEDEEKLKQSKQNTDDYENDNFERDYEEEDVPNDEDDDEDDLVEGSGTVLKMELSWSEWSPCSSTCNWGRRTRTSFCADNGVDLAVCAEAGSKRTETEACFLGLCPTSSTTTTSTTAIVTSTTTLPTPAMRNISVIPLKKKVCKVKCQNGGTCRPPYHCVCPHGVFGGLCQYAKPSCRRGCRNGGTCKPPSTCICPKGFFGNECQFALCKPVCQNGGTCIAPNKCSCRPGYVGHSCYKAVCPDGCRNGGECVAPHKCACRSGFSGADCSQPQCHPPCQNGGECVKPYFCQCAAGTRGHHCEKISCKSECKNGGYCSEKGNCTCPLGYTGHACEQIYCAGGCQNGGKCGKTGKCVCLSGYSGHRCEIKKPCRYVEVKEPYKRGFKQKVTTQAKVPCGAWGWKLCTKTKVHYEMVYKTFYKTSYECEGTSKTFEDYQRRKNL